MTGVIVDTDDARWGLQLRDVSHDFYHTREYTALAAEHEGGRPAAVLVEGRLLAPMLIQPLPGGAHDARTGFGYPSPLFTDAKDLDLMRSVMREAGIISYFSRVHPLLPAPDLPPGELLEHGWNVVVDLTADPWAGFRKDHRHNIEALRKQGFAAVHDRSRVEVFAEIYLAAMHRVRAAPIFHFGPGYFARLLRVLGDAITLIVILAPAGEVVAAGLFSAWREHAQYLFCATREGSYRGAPSKLLIWEGIQWARDRGAASLNLGGGVGGSEDSLYHFKLGFSRMRVPSRSIRMIVDPAAYRTLSRGHEDHGFFPAYRADTLRRRT